MKLIPVMTEKSMKLTKDGGYTFYVPVTLDKNEIRNLVNKIFNVNVVSVNTINFKARTKKNVRGKKVSIMPSKKAIVFLKDKEKIDLFFEEKKKTTKKKRSTKKWEN